MPEIQEKVRENSDDKPGKSQRKTKSFINKVIVRKLPPNLTSETFLEVVDVPDGADFYFVPADWSLGAEATSRAYIEFKSEEKIFNFKARFDGYVFVDSVRGSEYPAIVEYAPFQGLPKSRARKKDKNVGTIETEQHYLNFLDLLKTEEAENQKNEPKLEYSYQIKDDKKITSTPLIEFLAAKNQEKRDVKRKKVEEKKKQRDDDKQKKKIQVAKSFPEPIKESKEEVVYNDGVVVRTVPSRLSRNDRKKESKPEARPDKEKEKERREKEKADRDARRKQQREEARPEEKKRIDCVKISEIFLGKVPEGFVFLPKHRANAY